MASKLLLEMANKHEAKTGYSKKTEKDRIKDNEICLAKLAKIEKGNYNKIKGFLDY